MNYLLFEQVKDSNMWSLLSLLLCVTIVWGQAPTTCPPIQGFTGNIIPVVGGDYVVFSLPAVGTTSTYSLAFWYYYPSSLPSPNSNSGIVSLSTQSCDGQEMDIISANAFLNYAIAVTACNAAFNYITQGGQQVYYDLDVWQHIVVTVNGNTIVAYKNGVALDPTTGSYTVLPSFLGIGIRAMNGDRGSGYVTDVRYYANQVLTASQVTTVMTSVTPVSAQSFIVDGTVDTNGCLVDKASGNSACFALGGKVIPCPKTCNQTGTFRTQSDGDWGDQCSEGFATGCYRDSMFAQCFPSGLSVGCSCASRTVQNCFNMQFSSSADISNYLPQLGAPGSLDQSYLNPSNPPPISTSSGNFGGQVTALALSLGFSSCDSNFHSDCTGLGDLFVCDRRCECQKRNSCQRNSGSCQNIRYAADDSVMISRNNVNTPDGKPIYPNCEQYYGWTISAIFQKASNVLGDCDSSCPPGNSDPTCDQSHLNSCLTFINQAFIFGKTLDDVSSGTIFKEGSC